MSLASPSKRGIDGGTQSIFSSACINKSFGNVMPSLSLALINAAISPVGAIAFRHSFANAPEPWTTPPALLTRSIAFSASVEKTSITISHSMSNGNASNRRPASSEIVSASVVLCETAPCFLQSHASGTKVCGPSSIIYPPLVDFESLRDPAKSASAKYMITQSLGSFPTVICSE